MPAQSPRQPRVPFAPPQDTNGSPPANFTFFNVRNEAGGITRRALLVQGNKCNSPEGDTGCLPCIRGCQR